MSNYGLKISKEGKDVKVVKDTALYNSSKFDTFKIFKTGQMYIDLPKEDVEDVSPVTHTVTFTHSLGYIPFYLPMMDREYYDGDLTTGGDYIVNNLDETTIPAIKGWAPALTFEAATVSATTSVITLKIERQIQIGTGTFGKRRATLYYTIFYNDVTDVD